jgi:glc operon protein GlcG
MPQRTALAALLAAVAFPAAAALAQLIDQPQLSLAAAQRMAAAARAAAAANQTNIAVVVVDPNGDLILLERMDDLPLAAIAVAQGKARTAARTRLSTKILEDSLEDDGRTALLSLPELVVQQGALPVVVNGRVVGAIGCAGQSTQLDELACQAGIAALHP